MGDLGLLRRRNYAAAPAATPTTVNDVAALVTHLTFVPEEPAARAFTIATSRLGGLVSVRTRNVPALCHLIWNGCETVIGFFKTVEPFPTDRPHQPVRVPLPDIRAEPSFAGLPG